MDDTLVEEGKGDQMSQTSSRVYAIAGCNGLVKIGVSYSVANRLKNLRTMCCCPLELLASGPGREKEERALHLLFADVREHGEWFRLNDEDLAELKEILADESQLASLVQEYSSKMPKNLQRSDKPKPKRRGAGTYQTNNTKRGGSVRIGTSVKCKWSGCGKTFKSSNSLRAYCCYDHRKKAKSANQAWKNRIPNDDEV